jgi:hypothetical protein
MQAENNSLKSQEESEEEEEEEEKSEEEEEFGNRSEEEEEEEEDKIDALNLTLKERKKDIDFLIKEKYLADWSISLFPEEPIASLSTALTGTSEIPAPQEG